jgi:hypothetical protein
MQEMFATINAQVPNSGGSKGGKGESSTHDKGKGPFRHKSSQSTTPKLAKLHFPKYNGDDDPTSWICQVEQFFSFQNTPKEEQVHLAAYHFEGEVQLWYQLYREANDNLTWDSLKEGLHVHYGPTLYDDFFGDLTK